MLRDTFGDSRHRLSLSDLPPAQPFNSAVRSSLSFFATSSHELSPWPRQLNSAPNSRSAIVSFSLEPPRLFLDFSAPQLSSTAQQLSSASAALARPRLFSASAAVARPRLSSAPAALARPRLSSVPAALARPRLSSDSAAPVTVTPCQFTRLAVTRRR